MVRWARDMGGVWNEAAETRDTLPLQAGRRLLTSESVYWTHTDVVACSLQHTNT